MSNFGRMFGPRVSAPNTYRRRRRRKNSSQVGLLFHRLVVEGGAARVMEVTSTEERKGRPSGLNTVDLLKVASSALGIGPHHTMQVAERLYIQGYISYPRTESTAYPSSFDVRQVLSLQRGHPIWGDFVAQLLSIGPSLPKSGHDAGDHPPITPMRTATETELGGGDSWRVYEYVARHFIGSVSPDCRFTRTKVIFAVGGEKFFAAGRKVVSPGFTTIMPWLAVSDEGLPTFHEGEAVGLATVELHEGKTSPPDYLTESELISLMEKHGIGTDASIPVHINNICERNYAQVASGRRVVPTPLGITLVKGYQTIDPDLCLPDIRRFIEQQITLIAQGQAEFAQVVQLALQEFANKFEYFVSQIERMDALFEAQFSPLAASGKPMSRCGKCRRFMRYIPLRPARLFCGNCDEVLTLPQNGNIKLYKELKCPLDNYELLLFSLSGPDGKTYPLCPYCYNHPPFEAAGSLPVGVGAKGSGMPCTFCLHPTCPHSLLSMGVCACPECDGTLVLDPISGPKWRLDCNRCNCLVYFRSKPMRVATTEEKCEECGSTVLLVEYGKKGETPLKDGETVHRGCVLCDEVLLSLVEMKHGKAFFRRPGGSRGRGRGRGRGGRGRGRGGSKGIDPRMTPHGF
eukprot:TRINITY_DN1845_c0_g1_i9.p1 TRINITY_DN1845_c0_g1~~TRINITY_DN1845_c0_g1_i9.p1  ORF type:complete len:630 (+),score=80.22 TRINITY_DN1845_c0_g1_i9:2116-4005(+)